MRLIFGSFALALIALSAPISAQTAQVTARPKAVRPHYTTANTPLGDLLDDPKAKAVLEKYIPGVLAKDGIDMARGMTLLTLQQYAPDMITNAKLAAIDAALAKLAKS